MVPPEPCFQSFSIMSVCTEPGQLAIHIYIIHFDLSPSADESYFQTHHNNFTLTYNKFFQNMQWNIWQLTRSSSLLYLAMSFLSVRTIIIVSIPGKNANYIIKVEHSWYKLQLGVKSQKNTPHPAPLIISLEIFQPGLSSFMHILRSYYATV